MSSTLLYYSTVRGLVPKPKKTAVPESKQNNAGRLVLGVMVLSGSLLSGSISLFGFRSGVRGELLLENTP
jgi:hypothetical protein